MNTKLDTKRITIFLAIAFGWAYAAGALAYWMGGLFNSQPLFGGIIDSYTLILALLYMPAPAIAHLATRLLTGEGWQNLYLRPKLKQGWPYWLAVWGLTAGAIFIGATLFYLLLPQYFDPEMTQFTTLLTDAGAQTGEPLPLSPTMLLVIQVISALTIGVVINAPFMLGEEFGWRAYLQPKLMPLGPRKTMILMGIIWGLWHVPVIMMGHNYGITNNNQYWGAPWSGILAMCWMTFVVGTLLGWGSYKAGSVWPAVIGHGILNGASGLTFLFTQGEIPTLLGPAASGLIGSVGFTLFTLWALFAPRAWEPTPAAAEHTLPAKQTSAVAN